MKVEKKTITENTLMGLPISGPVELLEQVKLWLVLNWEGYVVRTYKSNNNFKPEHFRTIDKGGTGMFGVDKNGSVFCGLVLDTAETQHKFYVFATNRACPWIAT